MRTIEQYIEDFKNGKITQAEMEEIISKKGGSFKVWDSENERHPNYPEGNNESRVGFIFNPYHHKKGKFFQSVIKKIVLKAIDQAHKLVLKEYDPEGYVYEDERLQRINLWADDYIGRNFQHCAGYKDRFMRQVFDFVLFLSKEDIYYRSRFLDMMNEMPSNFVLTDIEQNNIDIWH